MLSDSPPLIGSAPDFLAGHCIRCERTHEIRLEAQKGAKAMWTWWEELHRADSLLAARLQEAGGKMIAVLVTENRRGETEISRAISGDLFGNPHVEGCAPPVIQHARFADLESRTLERIALAKARFDATEDPHIRSECVRERRDASRTLMRAINQTTTLCNRAGLELPLPDVFYGHGIPSGTADCALPKLLHRANRLGQMPKASAEVWFGPPLGERVHGTFAPPCTIRCEPILGHLLCHRHD